MIVTQKYLQRFALRAIIEQPKLIQLSSWELDGEGSITLDDAEGHALSYVFWDEWSADEQWEIKEGADKRWTFVTLQKDGMTVGEVGYEFSGLIEPIMLREWFRSHVEGMNGGGVVDSSTQPPLLQLTQR